MLLDRSVAAAPRRRARRRLRRSTARARPAFTDERRDARGLRRLARRRSRRRYPQVTEFIVGNEPNQPRFWQPQFASHGAQVSAAAFGAVPRRRLRRAQGGRPGDHGRRASGSRRAATTGRRARATSRPRRCASCGARRLVPGERPHGPLMDALSFHPTRTQRDRPARPRLPVAERRRRGSRPDQAGGLGRVPRHGAADDASTGSSSPRRGRLAGRHAGRRAATRARRTSRVTDEPSRRRSTASSSGCSACDPAIAAVNLFGFRDETDRDRLPGGAAPRRRHAAAAADAVEAAIAATAGGCLGERERLAGHTPGVVGARRSDASRRRRGASHRFSRGGEEADVTAGLLPRRDAKRADRAGARGRDASRAGDEATVFLRAKALAARRVSAPSGCGRPLRARDPSRRRRRTRARRRSFVGRPLTVRSDPR